MSHDKPPGSFSLKRWSQRKHAARREAVAPPGAASAPAAVAPVATSATPPGTDTAVAPLPPVESLTFDADFTGFMQPDVDPSLKNAALKKLFADPRFNVMDGLDVYIDDYSKPDPIDAETVAGLVQSRYLFDPPRTRVNARGEVEDVPADEAAAVADPVGAPADAAPPATPSAPAALAGDAEAAAPDLPSLERRATER